MKAARRGCWLSRWRTWPPALDAQAGQLVYFASRAWRTGALLCCVWRAHQEDGDVRPCVANCIGNNASGLVRQNTKQKSKTRRIDMTVRRSGLLWGILLIGAGALALAEQMGALQRFPHQVWAWALALISLLG